MKFVSQSVLNIGIMYDIVSPAVVGELFGSFLEKIKTKYDIFFTKCYKFGSLKKQKSSLGKLC